MMVNEIVIAIDPALRKIEEVLLWRNKFTSVAIFTLCHFIFWLFQNFNIRTYCTISCIFLALHLLDAYRTKKKREILRHQLLQQQNAPQKPIVIIVSSIGRYIIFINSKLILVWNELNRLKKKNRLQYFLLVFVIWCMTGVIGYKIKGFYLTYFLFWVLFFVPAIIHYDILRKILRKAMPLLEQLDHSMKYERRSILDKNQLLVDVKVSTSDELNDLQEDEYLESFKLDELMMKERTRKIFENLEDDDEEEDNDHQLDSRVDPDDIMDEEDSFIEKNVLNLNEKDDYDDDSNDASDDRVDLNEDIQEQHNSRVNLYHFNNDNNNKANKKSLRDQLIVDTNQVIINDVQNTSNKNSLNKNMILSNRDENSTKENPRENDYDYDDIKSFLPNESYPNVEDMLEDSTINDGTSAAISSLSNNLFFSNIKVESGDKLLKHRRVKNRPSLLDVYGSGASTRQSNEPNIDETFDFLDEYNK